MTTPQPAALPERFTKKPVTIEAVQFKNDGSSYALIRWINEGQHAAGRRFATWRNDEIIVPTLEGEHIASVGDWIIKGIKGEFYPCKPDIFEMTYDRAALQSQPAASHGVLMRLAAIAAECSDPDTTDALDTLIASTPAQPAAAGVSDEPTDEQIAAGMRELFAGPKPWPSWEVTLKRVYQAMFALRPQAVPMPCTWEQEDECGSAYSTTCGNTFMFEDGGPSDNGAKFCCYCGGRLSEQKWVEPADDDGITAQGAQGGEG